MMLGFTVPARKASRNHFIYVYGVYIFVIYLSR